MLTLTPETAYVTGGTIAYGGPWGAYLPIIDALRDKLSWLQMQYYNGNMYGKDGTSYSAGTVEGMVKQTEALIEGFNVADGSHFNGLPPSKVVIGLPAAPGAGGGYMSPSDVQSGFNTLKAEYPDLKGLMTWSINWDASNGYEFANSHAPYLGIRLGKNLADGSGKMINSTEVNGVTYFNLDQNYPNPFNPTTSISYTIPQDAFVTLKVYDTDGKVVAILVQGKQSAGHYSVFFDASKFESGIYLYRLTAGNYSAVKKMLLVK